MFQPPALHIPKITNQELEARYANLRPLYQRGQELWLMARPSDLRGMSFIWDPKLTEKVAGKLKVLGHFRCLHTWGHYALFKPTIAEVLAQVPEEYLPTAQLFQIFGPETADDLNKERHAVHAGFHVSTVVLYQR